MIDAGAPGCQLYQLLLLSPTLVFLDHFSFGTFRHTGSNRTISHRQVMLLTLTLYFVLSILRRGIFLSVAIRGVFAQSNCTYCFQSLLVKTTHRDITVTLTTELQIKSKSVLSYQPSLVRNPIAELSVLCPQVWDVAVSVLILVLDQLSVSKPPD